MDRLKYVSNVCHVNVADNFNDPSTQDYSGALPVSQLLMQLCTFTSLEEDLCTLKA